LGIAVTARDKAEGGMIIVHDADDIMMRLNGADKGR